MIRTFPLLLLACACNGLAQTNCLSVTNTQVGLHELEWRITAPERSHARSQSGSLFRSEATLRTFESKVDEGLPAGQKVSVEGEIKAARLAVHEEPVQHLSLSTFERSFEQQIYERLDRAGYFDRPELRSDSLLARVGEAFEPEPIHVGKTTVTCSVWTAIKKKNPLALLNPIVLNVSW